MSVNEIDEPGGDGEEGDAAQSSDEEGTSIDAFLSKAKGPPESEADGDDTEILELTREERLESLSVRAAPKQANEFVCTSCRLVKHQSQLADQKRELCRDCV